MDDFSQLAWLLIITLVTILSLFLYRYDGHLMKRNTQLEYEIAKLHAYMTAAQSDLEHLVHLRQIITERDQQLTDTVSRYESILKDLKSQDRQRRKRIKQVVAHAKKYEEYVTSKITQLSKDKDRYKQLLRQASEDADVVSTYSGRSDIRNNLLRAIHVADVDENNNTEVTSEYSESERSDKVFGLALPSFVQEKQEVRRVRTVQGPYRLLQKAFTDIMTENRILEVEGESSGSTIREGKQLYVPPWRRSTETSSNSSDGKRK
jgi:myosin heavy subunit